MFDIGWTEILVIAVVMIVVVGPKDLPPMLRAFGKMTGNLRKMAGEFRAQFDDALRESELDDVRKTIADAKQLNPTNALRNAINPLRQMGQDIRNDLQKATQVPSSSAEMTKTDVEAQEAVEGGSSRDLPLEVPMPLAAAPVTPVTAAPVAPSATPAAVVPAVAGAAPAEAQAASVPPKKPRAPRKTAVKLADGAALAEVAATKTVASKTATADKPKRVRAAKPVDIAVEAAIEKPAPRKRATKKTDTTPKDDA